MGQPEGPARPEDKRANFYWADLVFLNYKGAHGPSNFYWADLVFLNYKGAHGPARGAARRGSQFLTGQIWCSLIIREPMGQPEGPARPEDKRAIKFLLGRFGVP